LTHPAHVATDIVSMQIALLEAQRAGLYDLLLSFSTSEVYGSSARTPLTELARPEPRTPYAAAKAFCDYLTQSYGCSFGTKYVILRPFNNYGPRKRVLARAGIIPTAIRRLARGSAVQVSGAGLQSRDYIYVTDTVAAVVIALRSPAAVGEIIHVASGIARTIRSIVEDIARLMGVAPAIEFMPEREGDVDFLCGDGRKAQDLLGFSPTTSWEQGLERCIDYYGGTA
jgi:UDP-glucose 4-epimerase